MNASPGLLAATIEIALGDPAYLAYSNLPDAVSSEELVEKRRQRLAAGEAAYWALVAPSGQIAGIFELWVRDPRTAIIEAGYWVAEPMRRRGYAGEALRLVTEWVAERTEVERIELAIHPENLASRRLAARAGYEHLGLTTPAAPGSPREQFYELYAWSRDAG